jgi:hypothetical protein
VVTTEYAIHRDARNDADEQTDQDPGMKRHAFRFIGSLFVEIGGYLAFECVSL